MFTVWCKLDWKMSEHFITGIAFFCMSTARQRKKCSKFTFVRDYSMSLERSKITHELHCPVNYILARSWNCIFSERYLHQEGDDKQKLNHNFTKVTKNVIFKEPLQTPYWRNIIINEGRQSTMFSTIIHSETYPIKFATFFWTWLCILWLPKLAWTRNIRIIVSSSLTPWALGGTAHYMSLTL